VAKVQGGLLGSLSGKLAGGVFSSWKGVQYVRQWLIPANPRTADQVAQRLLFSNLVYVGKAILGSVLQVFWDPFIKGNSGWAHFLGVNLTAMHPTFDPTKLIVGQGTLENTAITGSTYAGPTVTMTWSPTCLGNGLATDKAVAVVYDFANHVAFVNASAARSAGTVGVTVGTGRNNAFMASYLFFADSGTAPTVVSQNDYSAVS
jgi:hypothetical protein